MILESLNGLDVKCTNIKNSYLNANPKEGAWLRSGQESGIHKGRVVVIIRALYGLKVAGSSWESELKLIIPLLIPQ